LCQVREVTWGAVPGACWGQPAAQSVGLRLGWQRCVAHNYPGQVLPELPSPTSASPAGGGAALLHLSELLPAFRETLPDEEQRLGCDIVMKALRR
jgi:hypothetical protein